MPLFFVFCCFFFSSVSVPPSALSSFYMPMPQRGPFPSLSGRLLLLVTWYYDLGEVKGSGGGRGILVLLPILILRQDMLLGLRAGTSLASRHTSLFPAAKHCLASVVALGKERVSCPCFTMVQDPGAQGDQGLIAFASALSSEAVDLCLVTLAGRRAFPTLSSQRQTGFASAPAMEARRFAAPVPAAEGFASFARRVQEVRRFRTCFPATADHTHVTKGDSLVCCPTSVTLVGTGRKPA